MQQFEDFLEEAHRLKSMYASSITLLVGLETELITSADLDHLQDLLKKHGDHIEYLVGSVHHVNGIPIDFDLPTFENALRSFEYTGTQASENKEPESAHMEDLLSAYFDAQYEVMLRFRPEIIGHFDLCRLYNSDVHFPDYPLVWEKIVRNVRFAVDYGALFEANAAAFRKGWQTAYPAKDVLEVFVPVVQTSQLLIRKKMIISAAYRGSRRSIGSF